MAKIHQARHLTDAQWLALIGLVKDDEESYVVTYPGWKGESAYVMMPDQTHREILANGEVHEAPHR